MADNLAFLTLDLDGAAIDLAVPAGTRLGEVLIRRGVPTNRVPYRVDGKQLFPDQRIGSDIPSGTLITLFPEFYDADMRVTHVTPARDTRAGRYAGTTNAVGLLVGILLTILAIYLQSSGLSPLNRTEGLALALATVAIGVVFALRKSWDRPLLEVLTPISFGIAAGSISAMGNFGEIGFQVVITASIASAVLCVLRWAWRGRFHRPTAQVSFDGALIGFGIGLGALVFLLTGLEFRLFAALVFGLSSPLFIALPGFTIKVKDSQLLNEKVVTREAKGVRRSTPVEPEPIDSATATDLMSASSARNQLWSLVLAIGAVLPARYVIEQVDPGTWQGRAAIAAIVCAILVLLLSPREARMHHLRIIPRCAAGLIFVQVVWAAAKAVSPLALSSLLGVAAVALLGASHLMLTKRKPLTLTRLADITQTLSGALVLPLSLIAIGIINLVRTGGLG